MECIIEKTKENHQQAHYEKMPEILSRQRLRETPPQILFTNPTMLEHILVRNKDSKLLENSKGKLRWILLDEAHTYSGSTATEMAMLIRRIIDAFGVNIEDVRFAATSATVGDGNDETLQHFIAGLTGVKKDNIKIISGKRILPDDEIDNTQANYDKIISYRNDIYKKDALKLTEINNKFKVNNINDGLKIVDKYSDIVHVRGHYFARSLGGLFVCTNLNCTKHGEVRTNNILGSMTTYNEKECSECGSTMLELVACRSCGNFSLKGQIVSNDEGDDFITNISKIHYDDFVLEENEDENINNEEEVINDEVYIAKYNNSNRYIDDNERINIIKDETNVINGKIEIDDNGTFIINKSSKCPFCGNGMDNHMSFRIPSSFLNNSLSDVILEQSPKMTPITKEMLYDGRKYISFTDSRQGTAKNAALINIASERNWVNSYVYKLLIDKFYKTTTSLPEEELSKLKNELSKWKNKLNSNTDDDYTPLINDKISKLSEKIDKAVNGPSINASRISWEDIFNNIINHENAIKLFSNINQYDYDNNDKLREYLKTIFFENFSRRLPRARSLENLGMISVVYPALENINRPKIAEELGIAEDEWQDLLKISIDYIIRYKSNIIDPISPYRTSRIGSFPIYNNEVEIEGKTIQKWPTFRVNNDGTLNIIQNRLILLICAGLGLHNIDDVDNKKEDKINKLLQSIWHTLKDNVLEKVDDRGGYRMNIENQFHFELSDEIYICPIKNKFIDRQFRGYSPWISGKLEAENISKYSLEKINDNEFKTYKNPLIPKEFQGFEKEQKQNCIKVAYKDFIDNALFTDLHEKVILSTPLFLAGEHSAQQQDTRLKQLVDKFEEGTINILSCSTTMEMGVDIGGISTVVMNNVPPKPANYLQRAGRAGRRAESKSLAFTFCAPNPIGLNAMQNPMWALKHKIASPSISFDSPNVIIRHINAFFMGVFIRSIGGMNIASKVNEFFFIDEEHNNDKTIADAFLQWLEEENIVEELNDRINALKTNTILNTKSNKELLTITKNNFDNIKTETLEKDEAFKVKKNKLEEEFGGDSPEYKSVNRQHIVFFKENIKNYLSNLNFLPSSGMSIGVVDFDIVTINDLRDNVNKENPSFHINRALTEYAPGTKVILDGYAYESAGIMLKSNWDSAKRFVVQSCSKCGYQRTVEAEENEISSACPHCNEDTMYGLRLGNKRPRFTEVIEPAGFAVDIFKEPTRIINRDFKSQYTKPILLNVLPWSEGYINTFDIRDTEENARILFYNKGKGDGYNICMSCGRAGFNRKELEGHRRLRGGKGKKESSVCEHPNVRENILLAGSFNTNFCEIRFKGINGNNAYSNDEALVYSLGVILTKSFSSYIGIDEQEISFGIKKYANYLSVFIFDNAIGGAGYSNQFSLYTKEIFDIAYNKLNACNCQTACEKCLIDRNSQWHIDNLDRNLALEWLAYEREQVIPDKLLQINENLMLLSGSIKDDIRRFKNKNDIDEIWFYVDNNVSEWDIENARFINTFISKDNKINIVVNNELQFKNNVQDRISAIRMSNVVNYCLSKKDNEQLKTVCKIKFKNGNQIIYYSEGFYNKLDEDWGKSKKAYYSNINNEVLETFSVNIPNNNTINMQDIYINKKEVFKASEFTNLILSKVPSELNLEERMQNQTFDVVYTDRYLYSPFDVYLLIQFIDGIKNKFNITINSLEVKSLSFWMEKKKWYFSNNYQSSEDRDYDIEKLAKQKSFGDININIEEHKSKLEHYRYFQFINDKISIIIRPDGGIGHGWSCEDCYGKKDLLFEKDLNIKRYGDYDILYTITIEENN